MISRCRTLTPAKGGCDGSGYPKHIQYIQDNPPRPCPSRSVETLSDNRLERKLLCLSAETENKRVIVRGSVRFRMIKRTLLNSEAR